LPAHTEANEAIEGGSISGHSRDPLINRGLKQYGNKECYRFVAAFDVKARIDDVLDEKIKKIEPNSCCKIDDTIICEKALIHSLKQRYNARIDHASATHKASIWKFPQQTTVKITLEHAEIKNAIIIRKLNATTST